MKKSIAFLLTIFICHFSIAANPYPKLYPEKEKERAIQVVKKFAEMIACDVEIGIPQGIDDDQQTKVNAITISFEQPPSDGMMSAPQVNTSFIVPWGGYPMCSIGSGSYVIALTKVTLMAAGGDTWYVIQNPNLLSYDYYDGKDYPSNRFISKLEINEKGQLEVITTEYQDGDANCCPSLKTKYVLDIDYDGRWDRPNPAKVISRKVLSNK